MCLALSPAYAYFHRKKQLSTRNRFNTTAEFFSIDQMLKSGFDAWWNEHCIRLQMPLFTAKSPLLEPFTVPILYSNDEIRRQLESHLERNRNLIDEDDYIDNLTITDNRQDHQERLMIDRMLGAALLRYVKKCCDLGSTFSYCDEYRRLKQASIADLLDPSYSQGVSEKEINKKNVYVNDQLKLFDRVSHNAIFGYFYSSESNPRLPTEELLWENGIRADFSSFKVSREFYSHEYLIKILTLLAPSTLTRSGAQRCDGLPNPKDISENQDRDTFIVFPDQQDDFVDLLNPYWKKASPHLDKLFSNSVIPRKKAAQAIADLILAETTEDSSTSNIDKRLLEFIAAVIPYLYQETNRRGSLDELWFKRRALFVETTNQRFGNTVLIR